jgi:hypothetical protein
MRSRRRALTLTITRHYFDLIKSGTKTTEYRRDCDYYRRLFDGQEAASYLVLHYRRGMYLVCQLRGVRRIRRPRELRRSAFIDTPWCYALDVASPIGPVSRESVTFFIGRN